jgi:hypothetical protein
MTNIIPIKCCLIPSPTPSRSAQTDICIRGLVYQNSYNTIKPTNELGSIVSILNYKELNFISRPYTINLPGVPVNLTNNFQIHFGGQLYIDQEATYKLNLITNQNAQYKISIDAIEYINNTNINLTSGLHSINIQYIPGNSNNIELKLFWNSIYTNNVDTIIPYSSWICTDPLVTPTPTPTTIIPSSTPTLTPTRTPTQTPTPTQTLTPTPSRAANCNIFIIDGKTHSMSTPLDTGINIGINDSINIISTGTININWPLYPGAYGPDGITAAGIDASTSCTYMALLGRIGTGPIFQVGSSYNNTASQSGRLYLFFNDEDALGDNSGFFSSTLCIIKPSPTPTLTPTRTPTQTLTPSITPTRTVTPTVSPSKPNPIQSHPILLSADGGNEHLLIKWSPPANPITTPETYLIEVDGTIVGTVPSSITPTSALIIGLENNKTYSIRLAAYYPSGYVIGNWVYGNTITAITAPNLPVGAESTIISARPGFSAIEVEWSIPAWNLITFNAQLPVDNNSLPYRFQAYHSWYTLYYSIDGGINWVFAATNIPPSSQRIIVSNLNSNFNYIFRLSTSYSLWGTDFGTISSSSKENKSIVFTKDYTIPTKPL